MGDALLEKATAYTAWIFDKQDDGGAAGGDRTHDPWLRRPILYPLSYSRAEVAHSTLRVPPSVWYRGLGYNLGLLGSAFGKAYPARSWFYDLL